MSTYVATQKLTVGQWVNWVFVIRISGKLRGYQYAQRYKGTRTMEPQPTYEELAEAIAQCVYDKIYLEVSRYYAENG